ncbi:MAG: hypothetical protein SF339_22680 [Blastocatellia bacterium]|nr:hypothetical protein [Blastocatellia bacterium]
MHFRFYLIAFILLIARPSEKALPIFPESSALSESLQQEPESLSFCELLKNSDRYDKKLITTEAILVVYTQPQVDGGESFFYDPACNRQNAFVLADGNNIPSRNDPAVISKLNRMIEKARKDKKIARVRVTITGHFFVALPPQDGFGHLSWAKFKIIRSQLSEIRTVSESTPWPDSMRTG